MADLSSRLDITVTRNSPNITRTGFGTPLLFGYVSTAIIPASQRTRVYSGNTGLTDMVTDGFVTTDPMYEAATALLSQTPRPTQFKIGRGALDYTHAVELTPTTDTTGETLEVTIRKGTTERTYTRTAAGGGIPAEATAIAALINADASGWGTAGSGELTVAGVGNNVEIDAVSPANDNEMWYYDAMTNMSIDDVTADRGMATDLTAIEAYDSDWYCLCLADAFGEIEIEAAAGWVETREKILVAGTQDSNVKVGSAGVAVDLSAASRDRTFLIFSDRDMGEYPAIACAGRFLPKPPGEIVWADKSLSGVTVSSLTTAQITAIEGDNCNHYTTTAGVGNLFPGVVSSGEYVDIIRLTDWVVANVREEIFSALRGSDKIPFTDDGVSVIEGIVRQVLRRKMPLGFAEGSDTFNAPLVADVSAANKAARTLPDVSFGATFAGAILYVTFTANLAF